MISLEGNTIRISGALTLSTASALHDLKLPDDQPGGVVVDLSRVDAVDSAAISLMMSWLRRARQRNLPIRYSNAPANLVSLARLYGVDKLLPLDGPA